jgi:hypothetical protein
MTNLDYGRTSAHKDGQIRLHGPEAFAGMRAYHSSEIDHKRDAIGILTTVLAGNGLLRCWAAENIAPTTTRAAVAARTAPGSATLTHELASAEARVAISSASKALTDVLMPSRSAASSAASAASPPRSRGLARTVRLETRNGSALGAVFRRAGTLRRRPACIVP